MSEVWKTFRLHNRIRKGLNTFVAVSSEPENNRHMHRMLPEETVKHEFYQVHTSCSKSISLESPSFFKPLCYDTTMQLLLCFMLLSIKVTELISIILPEFLSGGRRSRISKIFSQCTRKERCRLQMTDNHENPHCPKQTKHD